MKWGGSSKQQTPSSSGQTRPYGEVAIHSATASQSHLLASSSYLPTATRHPHSRGEDQTMSRPTGPLRLFKHRKDSELDDQQSSNVTYISASPTNPPSPVFSAHGSPMLRDDNLGKHMSISRSMNDIEFLAHTSPSSRELHDIDYSARDDLRHSPGQYMLGGRGPVGETTIPAQARQLLGYKQGWLNRSEIDPKKTNRLPVWKLQRAVLKDNYLYLYKPPSDIGIKYFDFSASFSKLSITDSVIAEISHQSLARHPGLTIDDNGNIVSGSIEAICHEMLFGEDQTFATDAILLLPSWTGFLHALETLAKLSTLGAAGERIAYILNTIIDQMSSALLDDAVYAVMKTLSGHLEMKGRNLIERRMTNKKSQLLAMLNYTPSGSDAKHVELHVNPREGIAVDTFLNIDIALFAEQIHIFHLLIFRRWNPVDDLSLLYGLSYTFARKNPLVSTNLLPHFLGTTMVKQLFSTGNSGQNSQLLKCKLLSKWILLGNILKRRGDMVGWLAIASIVCSPALCRLKDIWALVSSDIIEIVSQDWAPVIFDVDRRVILSEISSRRESSHILAPDGIGKTYRKDWVVPYFGDISIHLFERMSEINKGTIDIVSSRSELARIHKALGRWTTYISSIEDSDNLPILEAPVAALQECLYSLYEAHMSTTPISPLTIMEMSLRYESAVTGLYAHYYSSQRSPLSIGSYSAILFTEILPSYKLFTQKDLLEAGGLLYKKSSSSLKTKTSADPLAPQENRRIGGGSQQLRRASSFPPSRANITITGYSDLDTTSRNRVAMFPNRHFMVKSVRDVLNMGVNLYHVRNELVLKSFKDEGGRASRISSVIFENPSKRMSNGSRRLSAQFQPAAIESQIDYGSSQPQSVNVVAKAGTFDRLVDVLVVGVEDFSSWVNSEDIFHLQAFDCISFHMDMDVFTSTFFAMYRNFASPSSLLDALRRRFIGARSASTSLRAANESSREFPDWNAYIDETENSIDWVFVAKIHIGILEACNVWVSEYYSDLVNELRLRESFLDFLHLIDREAGVWRVRRAADESLIPFADTIEIQSRKLRKSFARKSYRPIDISPWPVVPRPSSTPLIFPGFSLESIEQFCDSLDRMVGIIFKQIKMKDWIAVYELFEMQTVDPHKLFTNRNLNMNTDDDIVIQDVFGFCASVDCFRSDEIMVSLFPNAIKKLYAFRMNLVSWVAMHIADPSLKKSSRVKRMAVLLHAIAICRKRMSVIEFGPQRMEDDVQMKIPSLVESAIASAIVRPESRQYAAAWAKAARDVGRDVQQVDFLEDIIPQFDDNAMEQTAILEPLTPCMGWIFERILEIVCYFPNMAVENPLMVNFDKQRYIYNFLSNVLDTGPSKRNSSSTPEEPAAVLLTLDMTDRLDKRQVREAAAREMRDLSHKASKAHRAFGGLVAQEQEKLRRDARQKEVLDRQLRDQLRAPYNKMRGPLQSGDRKFSKSSRFGGLLKAVRPLSVAFSNNWSPPSPDRSVSPNDLPEVSSIESRHKPSAAINLASAVASIPSDMQGMGVFKVVCDNGADFFFQATNDNDLDEWIKLCSAARASAIEKSRATADALEPMNNPLTKVFGVPIETVCKRENQLIPTIVQLLLAEIEARGLEEVGIYRVPGSLANVNELKRAFDSGFAVNMDDERWFDINTIAGCLKLYLRELPEPLLTGELFPEFTQIAKLPDENDQVSQFASVVELLPRNNYYLLKRIIEHLAIISSHGDINKMHAVNLAIVFSMSLLPGNNPFSMSSDLGSIQTMLRTMITYASQIFSADYSPGAKSSLVAESESFLTPPPPVPEKDSQARLVQDPHTLETPSKRESYQEVSVF
ncbi:hypothetical protein POJ06DRAFT_74971 [Lipomyces tetrasporus]|uniref:Uncharacterized protein n=1 Tax=Lipomyces tetrasporus TaxID=54092 RepID=A0AAD7QUZ1_9ASCO|nr:uncharacterized protein POJ06DRAFT_74971 [Lipomyces tetrasporus]KAJ8101998.1 hypothetical protein POJ06DRAFT_74971 [Lipomyces tetrasporus]